MERGRHHLFQRHVMLQQLWRRNADGGSQQETMAFALVRNSNQFTTVWANKVQPANTLTAEVRYYPAENSKLFTTLRVQSI